MRGYFDNDFFRGHFGPRFGMMGGPSSCPFRGDFPGHHGARTGFGPFGGFEHGPERHGYHQHGPEHHRRGPKDGHPGHGCGHRGTSDNDCDGGPGFKGPGGRPHDHGPSCRRPRFGRSPERQGHHGHGPEHNRRGPEEGHCGRRCDCHGASDSDSDGPAERHCHAPPGFRGHGGKHHGFHGHGPQPCFGRRGPTDFPDHPFRGPWKGPWGSDHPRFGRHGPNHPWFGHRRPCPYNSEERPSRKLNGDKCRENEPCCSESKENRGRGKGRKENGPCCDKDIDQNLGDTVFVQRIILEKATRPQSV